MATKPKRKKVSTRQWIDGQGNKVENVSDATGARYILLNPKGEPFTFDYQPQTDDRGTCLTSIFGFMTRVGNEVNSVINDKDNPGSLAMAAEAVQEFITGLNNGNWPEREGGVGARVDYDKLTAAVAAYFTGQLEAKPPQAQLQDANNLDMVALREKLETNDKMRSNVRAIPAVAAEYRRLTVGEIDEAAIAGELFAA